MHVDATSCQILHGEAFNSPPKTQIAPIPPDFSGFVREELEGSRCEIAIDTRIAVVGLASREWSAQSQLGGYRPMR